MRSSTTRIHCWKAGLVVIDTPGLNAIGAEPELTLGLLPSAHAVVFVLAADTGVTRSDLTIWRDHLGQASQERFVVLNKIDALLDPLGTMAKSRRRSNISAWALRPRWVCHRSACSRCRRAKRWRRG
jgi:predicted GTPase